MGFLRGVDGFRSIPLDLSEGTTQGGVLTIIAAVLCVVLFGCELSAFMTVSTRTRIVMDSNQDKLLQINFDISMSDMECEHITVGVWDSFGSDRLNITRNIQKQKLDHEGKDAGHPYTDDELLELEAREEDFSEKQMEEFDADWTSSSDNFKHDSFANVIDSHDLTMILFYADWCPPCRRFKPTWNEFEKEINRDTGYIGITDADGVRLGSQVRVLKINCVEFQSACSEESVTSYPSVRLYRRSVGSTKRVSTYEGDRSLAGLLSFLRTEAKKRHLHVGAQHHYVNTQGCRIRGYVEVTRVPGTLHIEDKSSDTKMMSAAFTNTSHVVNHFSFGDESPMLATKYDFFLLSCFFLSVYQSNNDHPNRELGIPDEYRSSIAPLDGKTFLVDRFHQAPHHYIKVVSTTFASLSNIKSYQITHQHRIANIPKHTIPQAKFSYDLAPVEVIVTEERVKQWYSFFTSALAIVGGAYTVMGLTSGVCNIASKAFKEKVGKLG